MRRKEVSAAELVATAFAVIEAINPSVNAVLETFEDEIRLADTSGPFFGVPFLLKGRRSASKKGGRFEMGQPTRARFNHG